MENIKNKKGFTIIELLVVIAIIGLLSTMAVAKTSRAVAKSRDADRLNDVKVATKTMTMLAFDNANSFFITPCHLADASISSCIGAGQPGDIETKFPRLFDPFFDNAASANLSPCTGGDTAPCQYSIANAGSSVSTAQIRFYLEIGTDDVSAGPHTINAEGAIIN